jgi:hypothetical protein
MQSFLFAALVETALRRTSGPPPRTERGHPAREGKRQENTPRGSDHNLLQMNRKEIFYFEDR